MSLWIEMRCDAEPCSEKCLSSRNAGPTTSAGESRSSLLRARQTLRVEAALAGWRRIPAGWACPECVTHPEMPK